MNYFRATFYDRYTPLTEEQIREKLTPAARAESASPTSDALAGKSLKIVLDDGPTLEYSFTRDTLTLKEGDAAPVSAPYAAKEQGQIILFTHMIPDTVRGYNIVIDKKTNLVTVFEVWFCGFEPDKREVWRHYMFGYVDTGGSAPEERHGYTNRIEGLGTYWKDDNGTEMLYFFPSLIWSSFVELSNPRGRITITAPSDYIKINDKLYIYSRVEQEYSGTFTLEVIDLFNVRHIGVLLGFDLQDKLDYRVYEGKGKVTGWSTNLEPLTYHGTKMPYDETLKQQINPEVKGSRPHYRPRFLYPDYTQEQVDEIIKTNSKIFEGRNIMTSSNTMETSDYLVGKRLPSALMTVMPGNTILDTSTSNGGKKAKQNGGKKSTRPLNRHRHYRLLSHLHRQQTAALPDPGSRLLKSPCHLCGCTNGQRAQALGSRTYGPFRCFGNGRRPRPPGCGAPRFHNGPGRQGLCLDIRRFHAVHPCLQYSGVLFLDNYTAGQRRRLDVEFSLLLYKTPG